MSGTAEGCTKGPWQEKKKDMEWIPGRVARHALLLGSYTDARMEITLLYKVLLYTLWACTEAI